MQPVRPDPDKLLKNLEAEECTHGKLKIFVGYAAGVGKTYAMLEAAYQRREQGIDVVVGDVETPQRAAISPEEREHLNRLLQLAEELGTRSHVLPSSSSIAATSQTIMDFARKNNITKIIVGKPLPQRWQEFLRGSLVDNLIHKSGDVDIYVVTSPDQPAMPPEENPLILHSPLSRYVESLLLVAGATALGFMIGGRLAR